MKWVLVLTMAILAACKTYPELTGFRYIGPDSGKVGSQRALDAQVAQCRFEVSKAMAGQRINPYGGAMAGIAMAAQRDQIWIDCMQANGWDPIYE